MGWISRIRAWLPFSGPTSAARDTADDDIRHVPDTLDTPDDYEVVRIEIAGWRAPFAHQDFLQLHQALAATAPWDEGHEVSVHHPLEAFVWLGASSTAAVVDAVRPLLAASTIVRRARLVADASDQELAIIDRTCLEVAVPQDLTCDELGIRAVKLHRAGQYPEARAYFDRMLELQPDRAMAYCHRAMVHSVMCDVPKALKDFDRALELDPDNDIALVNRGAERDECGDYDGALADYDRALQHDPDHVMALCNRGNTHYRKGNRQAACADWRRAAELGDPFAQERLAAYCGQKVDTRPRGKLRRRTRDVT